MKYKCLRPDCEVVGRGKKIKRCGRCHVARYCSTRCQQQHWGKHQEVCSERPGKLRGPANLVRYVIDTFPRELLRAADPSGAIYVWVPNTGAGPLRQEIAFLSADQLAETSHYAAINGLPTGGVGVIIDIETLPGRSLTTVTRLKV